MDFSPGTIEYYTAFAVNIATAFYHSWFMLGLKIFLGTYAAMLFFNIVALLRLRGLGSNIRVGLKGMDIPATSPSKMLKRWNKVKTRLKTGSETQLKVAILEADTIADEILQKIGYEGANMGERLATIKPSQLDDLDDLINAHKVRNHIVHDPGFVISKETAEEVIGVYENFLKYLEFLD